MTKGVLAWCRRHWLGLILLIAAVGCVPIYIELSNDKVQRTRLAYAAIRAADIRNAWLAQGEKSGATAPSLEPFVGKTHVVTEIANPDPDEPARTGFKVRAQGMRLAFVFDADQGPIAGQTFFYEFAMEAGKPTFRCWSDEIKRKWFPISCR